MLGGIIIAIFVFVWVLLDTLAEEARFKREVEQRILVEMYVRERMREQDEKMLEEANKLEEKTGENLD